MDRVPEAVELQWCIGEDFEAVTIGPYIVHLMFSAGGRVSSEYAIEHVTPAGA